MSTPSEQTRGLLLGSLGVAMFAMTLPMTRLAVGDSTAPQLPPAFVTAGRAAVAGGLSLLYLWALRAPRRDAACPAAPPTPCARLQSHHAYS